MDLSTRQLSSLQEMGITVWSLRGQDKIATETNIEVVDNADVNEQILNCQCIVIIDDTQHNEQANSLLYAMLAAVDIKAQDIAVISPAQLPQLNNIVSAQKVLLVLGTELANTVDETLTRGEIQLILPSQINTIVSLSLDELLTKPENKALAWQDLQLIKQALSHS